jgi:hypothetical protein
MSRFIKSKINLHDSTQLQTAFDYYILDRLSASSGTKKQRYDLEIYLFFPPQLNISPETYSKDDFYSDLKPLLRLKSPRYNYKDYCGESKKGYSPIKEMQQILKNLGENNSFISKKEFITKIGFLGCSLRSYFCRRLTRLEKKIRLARKSDKPIDDYHSFYIDLKRYQRIFMKWARLVNIATQPQYKDIKWLKKELFLLNDYLCISIREQLAKAYEAYLKVEINNAASKRLSERFILLNNKLLEYSSFYHIDYVSSDSNISDKEKFSLRFSYLKRYFTQNLYLFLHERKTLFSRSQAAYIAAASAAALWALVANIFIWYRLSFGGYKALFDLSGHVISVSSILIFLAFIIAYVLKDRIKEYGRSKFQRSFLRFLPDVTEKIIHRNFSNDKINIGTIYEYQNFISSPSDIPNEILNFRSYKLGSKKAEVEYIIHYHKKIVFNAKTIKKISHAVETIRDVIRFDVRRYIRRLDDPEQRITFMDSDAKVESIELPKVYYLDMIFHYSHQSLSGQKQKVALEGKRLILNKDGLVKIIQKDV